jgi:ATP-dependent exoDNAse (exonuclease V) alpha subunit
VTVHHYRNNAPGARYTTAQTLEIERDTIQRVLAAQNTVGPILPNAALSQFKELTDNPKRQQILKDFLSTTDQVTGLNGTAGSAKSTAAGILKKLAESQGYRVKGLAPTGSATDSLKEKGISSETLQMHLIRSREQDPQAHPKTLYIVDEASLASTRNINSFLKTLAPADHVILVGDDDPNWKKVGQHTSVEAGRVFKLLQEAGMKTAHFNRLYRQKTPELKEAVLHLRHGETQQAIDKLDAQGRIHEYANVNERFAALARFRAESPNEVLVVSPDNDSRLKLSSIIRDELQTQGVTQKSILEIPILIPRDATTADTSRAASYRIGDTVRYRKANREAKAQARSYATVIARDIDGNRITVKTQQGEEVTYNPARASGVSIYESRPTSFAAGDRIQFTTGNRDLGVSTRDTASIIELDRKGNAKVRLDRTGQNRRFNLKDHRHIDHAYVMTSHSSQSKTVHTIVIHVDTSDPRLRSLLNDVFAYVSASRGQYDIQIFTDDKSRLVNVLSRQNEEQMALAPEQITQLSEGIEQTAQIPSLGQQKDINTRYGIAI